MRARSLSAHGRAVSEPPERPREGAGLTPGDRGRVGALLFGYFLLGKQEKVTRPPGWRTKKHRDVKRLSRKPIKPRREQSTAQPQAKTRKPNRHHPHPTLPLNGRAKTGPGTRDEPKTRNPYSLHLDFRPGGRPTLGGECGSRTAFGKSSVSASENSVDSGIFNTSEILSRYSIEKFCVPRSMLP